MKITVEKNEKNVALLQALASKNKVEAAKAQESFAAFVGPVIQQIINNAPTVSALFETFEYNEFDSPSIPLELYTDVSEEDYLRVWSQFETGGLAYNQPTPATNELKFNTYNLTSSVAFNVKYARMGRLDVMSKTMTRLAQEVLLKQDYNSALVMLGALASASTKLLPDSNTTSPHIIRSHTANQIIPSDFLKMFTLIKRIRSSWSKGTPSSTQSRGLTDMIISPEIGEMLRGLAFNPVNTKAGVVTTSGTGVDSSAIALTDAERQRIYNSAGVPEFYGVKLIELNEMGIGYKWNKLFASLAGSTEYPAHWGAGGSAATFSGASEEIAIGLDLQSMTSLLRPVAVDSETGDQFIVQTDDQFPRRSGKIGWFGGLEEGRLLLDDRVLTGLVV
jgi:hypothetical protein